MNLIALLAALNSNAPTRDSLRFSLMLAQSGSTAHLYEHDAEVGQVTLKDEVMVRSIIVKPTTSVRVFRHLERTLPDIPLK